jgi:hypothetical protein
MKKRTEIQQLRRDIVIFKVFCMLLIFTCLVLFVMLSMMASFNEDHKIERDYYKSQLSSFCEFTNKYHRMLSLEMNLSIRELNCEELMLR